MFAKRLLRFCMPGMLRLVIGVAGIALFVPIGTVSAQTGGRVAVIGGSGGACIILSGAGFDCTTLPDAGPEGPLDAFDVVVYSSDTWSDPAGVLADFMRSGKGVITSGDVPRTLGIDTNPEVQAWIGANMFSMGTSRLITVATDPILGSHAIGTEIQDCNISLCSALMDTTGHSGAKILARFLGPDDIGLLRNSWEGGQSVYLSDVFCCDAEDFEFFIRSVRELMPPGPVPTVSTWGLIALTLLLLTTGSALVLRGRHQMVEVKH